MGKGLPGGLTTTWNIETPLLHLWGTLSTVAPEVKFIVACRLLCHDEDLLCLSKSSQSAMKIL